MACCLQTLSSDLPLFVATDNVNRTLLAPLLRAFPKVCTLVTICISVRLKKDEGTMELR